MSEPDEDMDPANWDCCDEHEMVFRKGSECPKCLEQEASQDSAD
jgi:hypothetical protein